MSDRLLLLEIVDALEEHGLDPNEYQLHRVVDVEALEQVVESADPYTRLEIRFSVGQFRVLVTQSDVTVSRT